MKGNAEIKRRVPLLLHDHKIESDYLAHCTMDPWESCGSLAQKLLHAGRIRKQVLMR